MTLTQLASLLRLIVIMLPHDDATGRLTRLLQAASTGPAQRALEPSALFPPKVIQCKAAETLVAGELFIDSSNIQVSNTV